MKHTSYQASVILNTNWAHIHLRYIFSSFPQLVLAHLKDVKSYFFEETNKSAYRESINLFPQTYRKGPRGASTREVKGIVALYPSALLYCSLLKATFLLLMTKKWKNKGK